MGCSVAYHLAKLKKNVVLLERGQLTCGSTFHAAGLVGQLRSSATITELLGDSVALYNSIEAETGQATGWKMNGGLRLACNEQRLIELERQATTAHSFGLEMHIISPKEAQDLWPLMEIPDVVGAAFLPTDGAVSPSDVTMALARGARMHGANLIENCPVTGVDLENGGVAGVRTERGDIKCEAVVNCCGQWARAFGAMAGVNVPLVSIEHQYLITEKFDVPGDLPTLRDPDRLTYYKEEAGGLVMGGYEPNPIPWAENGIPENFIFRLLESNFDHFEQLADLAVPRVPKLETIGIRQLLNGPESFTPDGNFILGEAPEVRRYFVGAGFNAFGIAAAGGAGKALAAWIVDGEPPYDLWPVDIRRFGRPHQDRRWVRTRTQEMYAKHYTISWPFEEDDSGRPLRMSPLYDKLKSSGACFGEKLGWERPNWFAPEGVEAKDIYSFGRQNWFEHVGVEHARTRNAVSMFDQTSFAKFMVVGRDAEEALNWICAGDVRKPRGHLTYCQMLNSRGGIECDLTVTRLSDDRFYIVTGTGFATHDFHWIKQGIPEGLNAHVVDMTSAYACIALMGPRARDVLAAVTDADVSNEAFPFFTMQEICVAGAPTMALRLTYVGELGWELHFPVEFANTVYDALLKAGEAHGIGPGGYRAIESLRLEKGYLAWGTDINPNHTPLEAGLGFAVKLKTDVDFQGRAALEGQKQNGIEKRIGCFTVDDPDAMLLGRETVYRDGERVGYLTTAGFGHTVQKNIGFGYVKNPDGATRDFLLSGSYELEIATERVPAEIHLRALYDPKLERVKC
jgi:4-methylaminobutanoate oxidase (formaldehyde-forming)